MICKTCGLSDGMVRDIENDRYVTWPSGRRFCVEAYRCLSCASIERVDRALGESEDIRDGRRRVVREVHGSERTEA